MKHKNQALTVSKSYNLPDNVWTKCQYNYNGESILDMAADVWCNMSVSDQQNYAQAYQDGYAKAKKLDIEKTITKFGASFVFRLIPPGRFWMGSPDNEPGRYDNELRHPVVITKPYYLGKTPVTQSQWQTVMGKNPSDFNNAGPDAPVEHVPWTHCCEGPESFCGKTGFALPTEAQWEYACRAGVTRMSYIGDFEILGTYNAPKLDEIAWYGGNSGVDYEGGNDSSTWQEKQNDHKRVGTHPVGKKKPNSFGLYDMLGNVWEWCQDWKEDYTSEETIDPAGAQTGSCRIFRGACWGSTGRGCRVACRNDFSPLGRSDYLGMRAAILKI